MFTAEQRDQVRDYIVDLARSDPRVTAGAYIGSLAGDALDRWSDIDITFGIASEYSITEVLTDWTARLRQDLGALHFWDLPSGPSIYRVFLLPSGLEIDLSVTPQPQFAARGPRFRLLFGDALDAGAAAPPDADNMIGLGWHHVLHARSSIERGKPWRAEYWIGEVRAKTLGLACVRLGFEAFHGRGVDLLPASVTGPLTNALPHSLDPAELSRALAVATACFLREVQLADPQLHAQIAPILREYGTIP